MDNRKRDYTFKWSAGNGVDFAQYKITAATYADRFKWNKNIKYIRGSLHRKSDQKWLYDYRYRYFNSELCQSLAFSIVEPVETEESMTFAKDAYVELPQLFGAGKPVTNAVTISYWANFKTTNYDNDERVFSSGSTAEGQVLLWSDNHNGLAFVIKTTNQGGKEEESIVDTVPLAGRKWLVLGMVLLGK